MLSRGHLLSDIYLKPSIELPLFFLHKARSNINVNITPIAHPATMMINLFLLIGNMWVDLSVTVNEKYLTYKKTSVKSNSQKVNTNLVNKPPIPHKVKRTKSM